MKLTREEAKEMLPIIQAWADGKTVDWYDPAIGWRLSGFALNFDKNPKYFRINSKAEPKYRSFKNQEECWDEMHKHPDFGWLVHKNTKSMYHITVIYYDGICLDINENSLNYLEAFDYYEFLDGTPFGIKED